VIRFQAVTESVTDPLIVWRKWYADSSGTLRSIFKNVAWVPRQRVEAVCLKSSGILPEPRADNCGHAPDLKCSCGIYGCFSQEDVKAYGMVREKVWAQKASRIGNGPTPGLVMPSFVIVGRVSLWGRIVMHESGVRAQFAYPYDLAVVLPYLAEVEEAADHVSRRLRSMYAVDVQVIRA